MRSLHSDEFENAFAKKQIEYPVILQVENNTMTEILTSEEINNMKNLQALIQRLKTLNL